MPGLSADAIIAKLPKLACGTPAVPGLIIEACDTKLVYKAMILWVGPKMLGVVQVPLCGPIVIACDYWVEPHRWRHLPESTEDETPRA